MSEDKKDEKRGAAFEATPEFLEQLNRTVDFLNTVAMPWAQAGGVLPAPFLEGLMFASAVMMGAGTSKGPEGGAEGAARVFGAVYAAAEVAMKKQFEKVKEKR